MSGLADMHAWFEAGTSRLGPVVLEGRFVRLLPMKAAHAAALYEAGREPTVWQWNPSPPDLSLEGFSKAVGQALELWERGQQLPFVIEEKAGSRLVGSTRYLNLDPANLHLEIGATWLIPEAQGTKVNPEAKYLLLCHAFETLGCLRVEFKTDSLNLKSRGALRKLGAKEEGTHRNHVVTSTGRIRHSVYFSIIREEWPEVKAGLERRLE